MVSVEIQKPSDINYTPNNNILTYTLVPLQSEDRSSMQQHHMEMLQYEVENAANSNKVPVEYNGSISEDEIRKSLLVEAKRRKCWNARKIEKMQFDDITHYCCFHYVLESFTETRSTADAIETSTSHSLVRTSKTNENIGHLANSTTTDADGIGSESGMTARAGTEIASVKAVFSTDFGQNPWDFDVQPDDDFVNQIKVLEMPNSHRSTTCHSCKGDSLIHCFHCRGFGTDKCTYCRGTGMKAGVAHPAIYTHPMINTFPGHDHQATGPSAVNARGYPFSGTGIIRPALLGAQKEKPYAAGTPVHFMAKAGLPPPGIGQHDLCIFCHGRGIRDCQHCKGQGKKHCITCSGMGQVRIFTKLKVAFAVECTEYYTPCEIPELLLRQANGDLIFSETRPYVQPIKKYQIQEINEISKRFCAAHLKKLLDSCRVLKQRHCVEKIEVARVHFRLGSKNGNFFVFGNQRLCYIPKGSAPSNCSIM